MWNLSSPTRDLTWVPCVGRQILNHWTTMEVSVQSISVPQSCLTRCNPRDCSMPGLPVHHQLPEFTQTHAHWSQWYHPTISSSVVPFSSHLHSFPASGSFPMSQLFTSGSQRIGISASTQSFQWTPRTDLLQDGLVGSPCSPRDSQDSNTSPIPQFKSINSSVLSLLYIPTLTSIHDHWKNHSFD